MNTTKEQRRALRKENRNWPKHLVPIKNEDWPPQHPAEDSGRIAVWRSREHLVQAMQDSCDAPDQIRLTINRTDQDPKGEWLQDITWDTLMRLKRECGFGDRLAIEFYPPDKDVVNVANMRHLFLIPASGVLPPHWVKK